MAWSVGTLDERLSSKTWTVLGDYLGKSLGGEGAIGLVVVGLALGRRRLIECLACVLLFLTGPLTFTHLYHTHNYYFFANNIFLVVAAGMAFSAMLEREASLKKGGLAGLLAFMVVDHRATYLPIQTRNRGSTIQQLGAAIRGLTDPDDVVVALGFDWCSEIPYYSAQGGMAAGLG